MGTAQKGLAIPRLCCCFSSMIPPILWLAAQVIPLPLVIFVVAIALPYWQVSLVAKLVKNSPAMQETPVWFLGQEGPPVILLSQSCCFESIFCPTVTAIFLKHRSKTQVLIAAESPRMALSDLEDATVSPHSSTLQRKYASFSCHSTHLCCSFSLKWCCAHPSIMCPIPLVSP